MADRAIRAGRVALVRPNEFGWDPETARDNLFQSSSEPSVESVSREFESLETALRQAGIRVSTFDGPVSCPSAVFPNNWFSTHPDGTLVLYPMRHESRRLERFSVLGQEVRRSAKRIVDLSGYESEGRFLEGTGSLVLDHAARIAFACLSSRTDEGLVHEWCSVMGFVPVLFQAEFGGRPVYHTNVVLTVGADWAVFSAECAADPGPVLEALGGKRVFEIDRSQVARFAGNMLELAGPVALMSEAARSALLPHQTEELEALLTIVSVNLDSIERTGGGSARCMCAELFWEL